MSIIKTKTNSEEHNYVRALLYGYSGLGKTWSLRTLPEDSTLVITSERSTLPLRDKEFEKWKIHSWDDLRSAIKELLSPEFKSLGIKFVAFDSLTDISRFCKRRILEVDRKFIARERNMAKKDLDSTHVDGVYDDAFIQEDWNVYYERMTSFLTTISNIDAHIIITSLRVDKANSTTKAIGATFASIGGQLLNELASHFDLVLRAERGLNENGEEVWYWVTQGDGSNIAKGLGTCLEPEVNPDWSEVIKNVMTKEL